MRKEENGTQVIRVIMCIFMESLTLRQHNLLQVFHDRVGGYTLLSGMRLDNRSAKCEINMEIRSPVYVNMRVPTFSIYCRLRDGLV